MTEGQTGLGEGSGLLGVLALHEAKRFHGQPRHTHHELVLHHVGVAEDGPALHVHVELLLQVSVEVDGVDEAAQ